LERLRSLHERGGVSTSELRSAEGKAREAESNRSLADLELKLIRERLEALDRRN
jgi:hypothetical protein